jgi:hypothetical protein
MISQLKLQAPRLRYTWTILSYTHEIQDGEYTLVKAAFSAAENTCQLSIYYTSYPMSKQLKKERKKE